MYRLVTGTAMLAHLGFVTFVITGGFVAWVLPWVIWPHVVASVWAAWVMGCAGACPLTEAENWGRARLGLPPLTEAGFIAHYLDGRLYPVRWTAQVHVTAFAAVAVSWAGLLLRG